MSTEVSKVVPMPVSDEVLSEMASQYAGLTADTKEGYEEVRKAIGVCVKTRTGIEAKRKELNEDALKWQRSVNAEAKRLTGLVEVIEEPLKAKKKAVDDEVERKRKELEERHRAKIQARINEYVERCGKACTYETAESMSENDWTDFVNAGEKEHLAQVEAEAKRKAEEEAERNRLAEELKAQQLQIQAQQAEAKRMQDELDQLRREKEEAERAKAQAEQEERDRVEAQRRKELADRQAAEKAQQDAEFQARKQKALEAVKRHKGEGLVRLSHLINTSMGFNREDFELAIGPQLETAIKAIDDLRKALRDA